MTRICASHLEQPILRIIGKSRCAITVVELLVVIAIIGFLLALSTLAVQSARETSRRLKCQDQLRQLQIATTNFESSHRELPKNGKEMSDSVVGRRSTFVGPFAQISEFMEVQFQIVRGKVAGDPENATPIILRCPSADGKLGYRFNLGTDWRIESQKLEENGIIQTKKITMSSITDGLSNTASLSERLAGDGSKSILRSIAMVSTSSALSDFDQICQTSASHGALIFDASENWTSPHMRDFGYHHTLPPHTDRWDCDAVSPNWKWASSRLSARSLHGAGVNLAMLDGSVQIVDRGIDPVIWRSWGTIATNEK